VRYRTFTVTRTGPGIVEIEEMRIAFEEPNDTVACPEVCESGYRELPW